MKNLIIGLLIGALFAGTATAASPWLNGWQCKVRNVYRTMNYYNGVATVTCYPILVKPNQLAAQE